MEEQNEQSKTDDSASIKNQKEMLLQYAMEQGWVVSGIYSDDDYTGSDRSRPEFNRLLKSAREKNLTLYSAKPSHALLVSWSWWKNISMDCFLSGESVL